jgi:hypothetical protein
MYPCSLSEDDDDYDNDAERMSNFTTEWTRMASVTLPTSSPECPLKRNVRGSLARFGCNE